MFIVTVSLEWMRCGFEEKSTAGLEFAGGKMNHSAGAVHELKRSPPFARICPFYVTQQGISAQARAAAE
jgi:hypothetical protein